MYCWNGFDFAADGRDEGGKPGQNQKGLVTFDRTIKKDAFYIYKAYLSREPFVHLCGRRYKNRVETEIEIKVYSNLSCVTLFVDGKEFATQTGDKVFRFIVPIQGEHIIEAQAGAYSDSMTIRKVDQPDPSYVKEGSDVVNWFDKPEELAREGYYSILDSMAELKKSPAAGHTVNVQTAPNLVQGIISHHFVNVKRGNEKNSAGQKSPAQGNGAIKGPRARRTAAVTIAAPILGMILFVPLFP